MRQVNAASQIGSSQWKCVFAEKESEFFFFLVCYGNLRCTVKTSSIQTTKEKQVIFGEIKSVNSSRRTENKNRALI